MIGAVVLAAGASSRFGRTKQVEVIRGKPLVQHAVDAASDAGVDPIVIVLGHDAERIREVLHLPSGATTVTNERYEHGQSTSLAAGLTAFGEDVEAAVVLQADQPGIRADHVRTLADAYQDSGAEILRLRFSNGPGPAILARSIWPEITAIAGDTGARALFDAMPQRVLWISVDEPAPADVDTPGDLERA